MREKFWWQHVSFILICRFRSVGCIDVMTEDKSSVAYSKLARMAAVDQERLWVLRPKLHASRLNCMFAFEDHSEPFRLSSLRPQIRDTRRLHRWRCWMDSPLHLSRFQVDPWHCVPPHEHHLRPRTQPQVFPYIQGRGVHGDD